MLKRDIGKLEQLVAELSLEVYRLNKKTIATQVTASVQADEQTGDPQNAS